jgi:tRNA G18 (ribose-2'-O)-methylase SpoU
VILYGWHTVSAALANPERQIRKLFLTENAARRLAEEQIETRVTPEIVRPSAIDQRLGPDDVHQGLVAEALAASDPGWDIAWGAADQLTERLPLGVMLDCLQVASGRSRHSSPAASSPPSTRRTT